MNINICFITNENKNCLTYGTIVPFPYTVHFPVGIRSACIWLGTWLFTEEILSR